MDRCVVVALVAGALVAGARTGDAAQVGVPAQESSLYVEADRDAEKLLDAARKAARARDWRKAIDTYQRVADFVGKKGAQPLVPFPPGSPVHLPVQDAAALELTRLPRAALDLYREASDRAARELFERALTAKDTAALAAVARRYLASSWGDDALAALGAIAFERADYASALAAWRRLVQSCPEPSVPLASIRARMWVCCQALGRRDEAERLARQLLHGQGHATIQLGGKPTLAADLLKQPATVPQPPPLDDWPMLGGDGTHARLPRGIAEVGEAAWTFRVPNAAVTDAGRREFERRGLLVPFVLNATVAAGRLFLANDAAVHALDARTGRLAWMYPDAPTSPQGVALDETVHAAASDGGRLFVRLADALTAFDARSGRRLWRHAFEKGSVRPAKKPKQKKRKKKEEDDEEIASEPLLRVTPPTVSGGRVVFGLTHLGEEARASVVALDAASGRVLWRTFICSRSVVAFLGMGAAGSAPAVAGGTVFYSTNLGAVAAVDAATGAVRWVRRYAAFRGRLRQSIIERNARWASNAPLVHGGRVFVAPQDAAELLALEAVDGSLAWSARRAGARYVVGIDGSRLFLAGDAVVAIDTRSGKRLWTAGLPAPLAGRPAVCRGRLFLPTTKGLVAVGADDGTLSTCRVWEPDERPGNVTLAAGTLFVASYDRAHAFADWAESRRRLAARRKAQPDDPAVPLALGSHEAHRGHYPAAISLLEQALRLASARKDDEAAGLARRGLFAAHRALGGVEALTRALAYAPDPRAAAETRVALASAHKSAGQWADAIAAWQALIERGPAVRLRTEGRLRVSARAMGSAEIGQLIRAHGRAAYAAQEARAAAQLAAAKTPTQLEAIAHTFPNSAAAEQALVRRLAQPDAHKLAPHLATLAHTLAPDPASEARANVLAKLGAWRQALLAAHPPLGRRWQVHTRVAHRRAELFSIPGLPPGLLYFATARRSYSRALPFDGLECRVADTGQLLWQREVSEWDRLAVVAGSHLVLATFDELVAVDPSSGVLRWAYSLSQDAEVTEADLKPAAGPRRERRNERRRIVGLAASRDAVFASLAGGEVFALTATDGKRLWGRELGTTQNAVSLLTRGLYAEGGQVCVVAESPPAVYGLDPKDGSGGLAVSWTRRNRDDRLTDRPAHDAAHGRLYLVLNDRSVLAVDLRAGRELWRADVDFGISRILVGHGGNHCYVLPDSFAQNVQIVSLDPATGKVRRRRSLQTGSLADAASAPGVLYLAARDGDRDLLVQALDPDDLGQRWRTVPLRLFKPSRLAVGGGYVAVSGRHAEQAVGVLIHAANGKVAGDVKPPGVSHVAVALTGDLFCLGTDRGIYAFGPAEPRLLDPRIAALSARLEAGDRTALPPLATALYQRREEERAIGLLARAIADEGLSSDQYAALKDQLNALRESLVARRPPVLVARHFDTPPNIDGVIDEPWRPDQAAVLDGPAHIEEIQGRTAADSRWRSPSDLSAILYTGWDEKSFYFAIDVNDDIHRTYTSERDTWVGDGLIISIDCDNDGGYGYSFTGRDILLTLALTRKDERKDDQDERDTPKGRYRVRRKDDNSGTVYEIAIPWSYMKLPTPKPGFRFGFNVTITDDDGDRTTKALSWTPGMVLDRERSMMIRGFTPALFGDVRLDGPTRRQGAGPRIPRPKELLKPMSE